MNKVYCSKVRLNNQGYEYGKYGQYWGLGQKLYHCQDDDFSEYYRADSRAEAIDKFNKRFHNTCKMQSNNES